MDAFLNFFPSLSAPDGFWLWFILGTFLLILEIFASGALLWLSIAALTMGIITYIWPMDWRWQLCLFSVLSVANIILLRKRIAWTPLGKNEPLLNRRAEQYIGQGGILSKAIKNGVGRVKMDDSSWVAKGPNMEKGTRVRITGSKAHILEVEKIDD